MLDLFRASMQLPSGAKLMYGSDVSGKPAWLDFFPGNAYGSQSLTPGSTGSPNGMSGSNYGAWLTSIGQAGGGPATSNGTVTFTFAKPGRYLVFASATIMSAVGYTGSLNLRHIYGGTAGFIWSNVTTDHLAVGTNPNDQTFSGYRFIVITAASQTLTINTTGLANNVGGALTLHWNYGIIPLIFE